MTLVNIMLRPDRALVATDTLAFNFNATVHRSVDGTPVEVSKVHVFPHANCVLVVRGTSALMPKLCTAMRGLEDIDAVIEKLPALLSRIGEESSLMHAGRTDYPGDEVHVIGWSTRLGRMLGTMICSESGFRDEVPDASVWGCANAGQCTAKIAPYASMFDWRIGANIGGPLRGMPDNPDEMLAFCRWQLEYQRAANPAAPYGGRLMVVEMNEHWIRSSSMGDIGIPSLPAHASGRYSDRVPAFEPATMPSTAIATVALVAALAGCGGGGDTEESANIAADAATAISSVLDSSTHTLNTGLGVLTELGNITFTSTGSPVRVHGMARANYVSAGLSVDMPILLIQGPLLITNAVAGPRASFWCGPAASVGVNVPFMFEATPGAGSVTYRLATYTHAAAGDSYTVSGFSMLVEEIKR